ncbi:MAG: twin-arginine translocation signal domain-containing protein [Xanthobacteraceae bacterium]|nr:twin-arginine translocation signal domain-containing protein [Xanthobacteraceae bacterium]
MIDRRDVMKALAVAGTAAWLHPDLAHAFSAPGNAALRMAEQDYAVGELLPFAMQCEVSGLVLRVGKIVKAERQADGSWWYDVELQSGKAERIPEDTGNELVAEGNADEERGETIRFIG